MDTAGYSTNYTDPGSGMDLPQAWISPYYINYCVNKYISFDTFIYLNQTAYNEGKDPIYRLNIVVDYDSADWLSYFQTSVLNQANANILGQALIYLKTLYPENQ